MKDSEYFVNRTFIYYLCSMILQFFRSLNTSSTRGADYQNHNTAGYLRLNGELFHRRRLHACSPSKQTKDKHCLTAADSSLIFPSRTAAYQSVERALVHELLLKMVKFETLWGFVDIRETYPISDSLLFWPLYQVHVHSKRRWERVFFINIEKHASFHLYPDRVRRHQTLEREKGGEETLPYTAIKVEVVSWL